MKKDYNRDVMSDMPVDSSFTPSVEKTQKKTTTTKPKINAIGTQKRTTKTSSSKTGSSSKTSSSKTSSSKTSSSSKTNSSKTTNKSASTKKTTTATAKETSDKKLRTKLTNSEDKISDLEKLNEQNIKTYRFKSKRNKVVIAILAVVLAIEIISLIVFFTITHLKTNCNMIIHGKVDAECYVDGMKLEQFRCPSNLQGNRILQVNIQLNIKDGGQYNIRFTPKCYQKGVLMENTLIYEHNTDLFRYGGDGYYYSLEPIGGNQMIWLCDGVILDYIYEDTLNVDNFKLDFHIYIEKV